MARALKKRLVFPPPVGAAQVRAGRREGSDRSVGADKHPGRLVYAADSPAVQPNALDWDLNRSSRAKGAGLTRINPASFSVRAGRRKDVHGSRGAKKRPNYRGKSIYRAD